MARGLAWLLTGIALVVLIVLACIGVGTRADDELERMWRRRGRAE